MRSLDSDLVADNSLSFVVYTNIMNFFFPSSLGALLKMRKDTVSMNTYSVFLAIAFIIRLLIVLYHYYMQLYPVPYRPGRLQLP